MLASPVSRKRKQEILDEEIAHKLA